MPHPDDDNAETGVPRPPPIQRRVCFPRGQIWGLLLLASFPVLALFGVFGSRERSFSTEGGGVALEIAYAQRLRYGHPARLKIRVQPADNRPLNELRVRVGTAFLERFDEVSAIPEPVRVSEQSHEFVAENGAREFRVTIQLKPKKYGAARGRVVVVTPDGPVTDLPIRAFILP